MHIYMFFTCVGNQRDNTKRKKMCGGTASSHHMTQAVSFIVVKLMVSIGKERTSTEVFTVCNLGGKVNKGRF